MHADTSFRNGSGASTKCARNLRKYEFWTYSSGLGMFVARKQETVLVFLARVLDPISQRCTCSNQMVQNQTDVVEHRNGVKIPKILVLVLKECIKIFQVVCLES